MLHNTKIKLKVDEGLVKWMGKLNMLHIEVLMRMWDL